MTSALIFGALFVVLSICVFSDAPFVMRFDAAVDRAFAPLRTRGWSAFFSIVTFFGSVQCVVLMSCVVVLLTAWNTRVIELSVTAVGGAGLVVQLVKLFTARIRPEQLPWRKPEIQYSYPSWHAAGSVALYGMLAVLLAPFATAAVAWFIAGYVVLIIAIGVSRVALSVHHASDVLGGYLLGISFLALAVALF